MPLRRIAFLSFFAALAVLSCGSKPKTFDVSLKHQGPEQTLPRPQIVDTFAAADMAIGQRRVEVFTWLASVHTEEQPHRPSAEPRSVVSSPQSTTAEASPSSMPCDGEYPPCYVAQRESGNTYDAYNPTGCGGNGCYGRWQFSGAWAGKLGLPDDLSQATPEQQDAAARSLWANGSGCSNWGAC